MDERFSISNHIFKYIQFTLETTTVQSHHSPIKVLIIDTIIFYNYFIH